LRYWSELSVTEAVASATALLVGDVPAATTFARDALRYYDRSNYRFAPALAYPALARTLLLAGDVDGARDTLRQWRAAIPGAQSLFDIAVLAVSGDHASATNLLEQRRLRVPALNDVNILMLPSVVALAEIACELHLRPELEQVLPVIDGLCDRGVLATHAWPAFLPRLGVRVAAELDDHDAARRSRAENAAMALGFP
jgi:hypothetical protein